MLRENSPRVCLSVCLLREALIDHFFWTIFLRVFIQEMTLEDWAGVFPWNKGQACLLPSMVKMSPPGILSTYCKRLEFLELKVPFLLTQPTVCTPLTFIWISLHFLWVLVLGESAQMPILWLQWLLWVTDYLLDFRNPWSCSRQTC